MKNKDKWKTFPCKECLLKGKCSEMCFNIPVCNTDRFLSETMIHEIEQHIDKHGLQEICLACGGSREGSYIWACCKCQRNILGGRS